MLQDDPPPPEDDENKEKRTDDISTWDADFLKVEHYQDLNGLHVCEYFPSLGGPRNSLWADLGSQLPRYQGILCHMIFNYNHPFVSKWPYNELPWSWGEANKYCQIFKSLFSGSLGCDLQDCCQHDQGWASVFPTWIMNETWIEQARLQRKSGRPSTSRMTLPLPRRSRLETPYFLLTFFDIVSQVRKENEWCEEK